MEDLTGALKFLIADGKASGPYNLTSPQPVRNRDLAASLGRALHRPVFLPAPGLAIRLAMGELGNVVLRGQRVLPARLQEAGYTFRYPGIDEALSAALLRGNQR
jgi:NAD dependent epimerase/dehydratase family enzyme